MRIMRVQNLQILINTNPTTLVELEGIIHS